LPLKTQNGVYNDCMSLEKFDSSHLYTYISALGCFT